MYMDRLERRRPRKYLRTSRLSVPTFPQPRNLPGPRREVKWWRSAQRALKSPRNFRKIYANERRTSQRDRQRLHPPNRAPTQGATPPGPLFPPRSVPREPVKELAQAPQLLQQQVPQKSFHDRSKRRQLITRMWWTKQEVDVAGYAEHSYSNMTSPLCRFRHRRRLEFQEQLRDVTHFVAIEQITTHTSLRSKFAFDIPAVW
ncbi:hypothetical protein B0H13DRAFT_1918182 [Mycena leptocephala]|nr:hypothetical protein B0H13DRAFT_1918182 [Mycena leptocephala]